MPVCSAPKPKRKPRAKRAHNSTLPQATKPLPQRKKLNSRNPRRREREYERCFGGNERVAFVKTLCCVAGRKSLRATCEGQIENAHTETGGMSRKADYQKIIPLCKRHHHDLHQYGVKPFEKIYEIRLAEEAAGTQEAWEAFHGGRDGE